MPAETPSAPSQASVPQAEPAREEPVETSVADARIAVRVTANNNLWLARNDWAEPVVTRYGACTARLMPQPADDAFIGENRALLDNWHRDAQARGLSPATIDGYLSSLRRFACYMGPRNMVSVRSGELQAYTDFLKAVGSGKPQTLSGHFTALSSLYDYLTDEGLTGGNPVPLFRRRHLAVQLREANKRRSPRRRLLSVDEMSLLVQSISDVRDRAILMVLAKTGVRCGELVAMDVKDVDWKEQSIHIKPLPKRTHLTAFFDPETEGTLRAWLEVRSAWTSDKAGPLFVMDGQRIDGSTVGKIVSDSARRLGLHDPTGSLRFRFTPHACRHWFTTHLLRAGMKESTVQILRGDSPGRSMDRYHHIDWDAVRQEYLKRVPKLLDERQRRRAAVARANLAQSPSPPPVTSEAKDRASPATLELRGRLAQDLAANTMRPPCDYAKWLQGKTGRPYDSTRETVRKALRSLGVPAARAARQPITSADSAEMGPQEAAIAMESPSSVDRGENQAMSETGDKDMQTRGLAVSSDGPQATPAVPRSRRSTNLPGAKSTTLELRAKMSEDIAAGCVGSVGRYLSWLQAKTGTSRSAAGNIVRREMRARSLLPAAIPKTRAAAGSPEKGVRPLPPDLRIAWRSKPGSGGRRPNPETVCLREALLADLIAGRIRPRTEYLAVLATGTPKVRRTALGILNREAKRILGHSIVR